MFLVTLQGEHRDLAIHDIDTRDLTTQEDDRRRASTRRPPRRSRWAAPTASPWWMPTAPRATTVDLVRPGVRRRRGLERRRHAARRHQHARVHGRGGSDSLAAPSRRCSPRASTRTPRTCSRRPTTARCWSSSTATAACSRPALTDGRHGRRRRGHRPFDADRGVVNLDGTPAADEIWQITLTTARHRRRAQRTRSPPARRSRTSPRARGRDQQRGADADFTAVAEGDSVLIVRRDGTIFSATPKIAAGRPAGGGRGLDGDAAERDQRRRCAYLQPTPPSRATRSHRGARPGRSHQHPGPAGVPRDERRRRAAHRERRRQRVHDHLLGRRHGAPARRRGRRRGRRRPASTASTTTRSRTLNIDAGLGRRRVQRAGHDGDAPTSTWAPATTRSTFPRRRTSASMTTDRLPDSAPAQHQRRAEHRRRHGRQPAHGQRRGEHAGQRRHRHQRRPAAGRAGQRRNRDPRPDRRRRRLRLGRPAAGHDHLPGRRGAGSFADGITIWTGFGDDTIWIDGTPDRAGVRTITTLNTGLGDDTVYASTSMRGEGRPVRANTQGPWNDYPQTGSSDDDTVLGTGTRPGERTAGALRVDAAADRIRRPGQRHASRAAQATTSCSATAASMVSYRGRRRRADQRRRAIGRRRAGRHHRRRAPLPGPGVQRRPAGGRRRHHRRPRGRQHRRRRGGSGHDHGRAGRRRHRGRQRAVRLLADSGAASSRLAQTTDTLDQPTWDDIIVTGEGDNIVLAGMGDDHVNDPAASPGAVPSTGDDIVIGDNGEFNWDSAGIRIVRQHQRRQVSFTPAGRRVRSTASLAGTQGAPAFVDLDGDGDLDLVAGGTDGTLRYFENTGTASVPGYVERFDAANPFDAIDVGSQSTPSFADLDGDGDLDLAVGAADGTLSYFENTGTTAAPVLRPADRRGQSVRRHRCRPAERAELRRPGRRRRPRRGGGRRRRHAELLREHRHGHGAGLRRADRRGQSVRRHRRRHGEHAEPSPTWTATAISTWSWARATARCSYFENTGTDDGARPTPSRPARPIRSTASMSAPRARRPSPTSTATATSTWRSAARDGTLQQLREHRHGHGARLCRADRHGQSVRWGRRRHASRRASPTWTATATWTWWWARATARSATSRTPAPPQRRSTSSALAPPIRSTASTSAARARRASPTWTTTATWTWWWAKPTAR